MPIKSNFIYRDAEICNRIKTDSNYNKRLLYAYDACETLQISSLADYTQYERYIISFKNIDYYEITYFLRMTNEQYADAVNDLARTLQENAVKDKILQKSNMPKSS